MPAHRLRGARERWSSGTLLTKYTNLCIRTPLDYLGHTGYRYSDLAGGSKQGNVIGCFGVFMIKKHSEEVKQL